VTLLSLHKRENPVTIDQPKGASGIDGSKKLEKTVSRKKRHDCASERNEPKAAQK
jgi:hypothetical protein